MASAILTIAAQTLCGQSGSSAAAVAATITGDRMSDRSFVVDLTHRRPLLALVFASVGKAPASSTCAGNCAEIHAQSVGTASGYASAKRSNAS